MGLEDGRPPRSKFGLSEGQISFQDALEILRLSDGKDLDGHLRLAEVYWSAEQYSEAMEEYQACFRISKNDKEHYRDLVNNVYKCRELLRRKIGIKFPPRSPNVEGGETKRPG